MMKRSKFLGHHYSKQCNNYGLVSGETSYVDLKPPIAMLCVIISVNHFLQYSRNVNFQSMMSELHIIQSLKQ